MAASGVDLTACVLPVASWRHRSLPASLAWSDVERLLVACEQSRRGSRRDRAILLLLARLGLRAGEVAALTLDDLDWRVGEIVVTGKNAGRDRLPVPVDVGEAIVDYICHERPATTSRALLILSVAPRQPMTARTVGWVVRCACDRAGIAQVGPHRLRHTAATVMLNRGAAPAEIGQVLRHEHRDTTAIYAKVDLIAPRPLAFPWPEAPR